MKEISYVTNEGQNIKFNRYTDVLNAIVCAGAFIETKPQELATLNKVLSYKKKLEEKIAIIEKDDRAEDIHLFCVDLYYLYLLRKFKRQISYCDTIIGLYSCLYDIDFENLDEVDRNQIMQPGYYTTIIEQSYTAEEILNRPLNRKFFDCNLLLATKYATYLFNRSNPQMYLSECEFFEFQEKALQNMKKKNRRK